MTEPQPPAPGSGGARRRIVRNLVTRSDGKLVNVARKRGQLFVCAVGCCCGDTVHGAAPVPTDLYHNEWERRRLRPHVHLSIGGCLGPCVLANVVMLLFDGRPIWFHSFNTERLILALYDYIESMVAAQAYLPPPAELADLVFNGFGWDGEAVHRPVPASVEAVGMAGHVGVRPQPGVLQEGQGAAAHGGFVFLTHADTDLLALSRAREALGAEFPPIRGFNIGHLKDEEDARVFVDAVVPDADVVVLRLLGGAASFRGGFERAVERAAEEDQWLVCLPGTDALDPELTAASNVGAPVAHEALAYLQLGGPKNVEHMLRFLSDHLLTTGFGYDPPEPEPRHGVYYQTPSEGALAPEVPTIGVLFYRSHLLAGNTAFVDAIAREIERRGARALAVYTSSLQELAAAAVTSSLAEGEGGETAVLPSPAVQGLPSASARQPAPTGGAGAVPAALQLLLRDGRPAVDAVIATTSFAASTGSDADDPFVRLGVPVVQAVAASTRREQWRESVRGLSPVDTAMNVAIPELDGRIIALPVCFKNPSALTTASTDASYQLYEPNPHGIARAVGLALRLAALRRKPNREKRIAVILTNANARASRVGAAVGLDTPASVLRILEAMRESGYRVGELPASGDALLHALIDRGSYDREVLTAQQLATTPVHVAVDAERRWLADLPEGRRSEVGARWGEAPGQYYVDGRGRLALPGLIFGNVFVAVQPPRGYGLEPSAIYHSPDLPPPYPYHALYRWLSEPAATGGWGADAIVHVGKHGTLEWLPGKSVGLSEECYPDLFLGDIPLVYPFIINNPGEGAQAKRRAHAVIVDHLTPPMTTAEGYGEVEELSRLVDEYYQLEQLDPSKLPLLQQQIWELIKKARLDADLEQLLNRDATATHTHPWDPQAHEDGVPYTISDMGARDFAHLVENVNGYLCELTSAQIRDGLHTLGKAPEGRQLIDTLLSLVRLPNLDVPSLRAGLASFFGLELWDVLEHLDRRVALRPPGRSSSSETLPARTGGDGSGTPDSPGGVDYLQWLVGRPIPTNADILEAIDELGRHLLERLADSGFDPGCIDPVVRGVLGPEGHSATLADGATARPIPLFGGEGWSTRAVEAGSAPRERRWAGDIAATLRFVCETLVPNLRRTDEEVTHLLRALSGEHVAAGPSGAPTRGMAQVLPTGRNFYTVDPRGLPSLAAWTVGQQLADALLQRHLEDEGRYPETVGISIWGTSLMRTHGDDVAEVLALIGVRPRWQAESRRLVGFDVIPLAELGRPRVDVVCRISGFFRDAFPDLIALMDDAFKTVAALDEPLEQNAIRRHTIDRRQQLVAGGVDDAEATRQAGYRIFGSPPGAYGAGILPLIDERNWRDDADLAEVYVNWGGYAYTARDFGIDARGEFRAALARVEAAVKNQDNREHDIFDSDDYFQYHGGMIAAIRALGGRGPRRYFGDSADPARPRVRDLKEEALRVFRTRVVNPKWIDSMRRHGYKGALEMAATVDYLFGYDATSDVVDDWMYERLTAAYALDPDVQSFFRESNPWALRELAARLLEAMDRGLWREPSPEMRQTLQSIYLLAESDIETRPQPSGNQLV